MLTGKVENSLNFLNFPYNNNFQPIWAKRKFLTFPGFSWLVAKLFTTEV